MGSSQSTSIPPDPTPPGGYPTQLSWQAGVRTSMSGSSDTPTPTPGTVQNTQNGPAPAVPTIRLPSVPTAPGIWKIPRTSIPQAGTASTSTASASPGPSAQPTSSPGLLQRAESFFVSILTPDVTHTHGGSSPSSIRLTTLYLTHLKLPPELIPRILEYAEFTHTCFRECKRETKVIAGPHAPLPRTSRQGLAPWTNGQEDELRSEMEREKGLKDKVGNVWFLASEEVGCVERKDAERVEEGLSGLNLSGTAREAMPERYDGHEGEGTERENKDRRVWVRSVKVRTLSKDQGWSSSNQQSYGTYDNSYTWFELALLRNGEEVEGSRFDFQHNVHAGQYYKEHENTFDSDHEFVKKIQPGDRIILWARAMYPGWQNFVREASITITTGPYPLGA